MKKLFLLLVVGVMLTGMVVVVRGDTEGSASAHVFVKVDPNVGVQASTAIVNAGTVQTGDFTATIDFRVDANLQVVTLYAAASPLFKGDDPLGTEVQPIPLNVTAGIEIDPDNANPLGGGSQVAAFLIGGATEDIDGFPGVPTEQITFESSQNNHFSQNVRLTVTWNQDDPEKPTGEYSGKVKLTALLLPASPSIP
ncbi:MAG: hypothetical protein ISS69_00275 [Phycisphaerae bacterium]|nr:hypothetical protein [Phycisphaerae bacterium]